MRQKILVVDDNRSLVEALKEGLRSDYSVTGVFNVSSALREIGRTDYDCMILDIGLPDMSGYELLKVIRENEMTFNLPVIMFTIRAEKDYVISGLLKGADKYLTKAISISELKANIKALLRRIEYDSAKRSILTSGDLIVDSNNRKVNIGKRAVILTRKEFDILVLLLSKKNNIIEPATFYRDVWNYGESPLNTKTLEIHIYRLRKKLSGKFSDRIKNIPGKGYIWNAPNRI